MLRFLTFLGGLFAVGLALISIAANFWFGMLLTTGQERWVYGAVFALLDALKSVLPVIAAAAFAAGLVAKGRVAASLFGLLSVLSFTAGIGLYATTKSGTVGDAKATRALYEQAVAAKTKADADLAAVGPTRPTGEVAGELAALKRDRLYDRSKQCTDATAPESRDLCANIDRLAGEHSKSLEAVTLRQAADNAAAELQKQDVASAMRAIDPQAEALAKLVSPIAAVEPETVRTALAVLIALLVELGSGLGPWLVSPSAPRTKELVVDEAICEDPESAPVDAAAEADVAIVPRWASVCLVRRRGAFVPAAEARAAFEGWCVSQDEEALNATAFGKAMTALGYERRKVGGVMRYEGVALTAAKPSSLRVAVDNTPVRRTLGRMTPVAASAGRG